MKKKVVYQLYPKSFNDTNGDGIGDIPGIIEKVPYLAELGIDVIWLNPFYISPQKDNGYDITDYTSVDPMFGTMADFEQLVDVAQKHHIDLMLDMVFNHTSITHEWFQKALSGDPYYQYFYIIRDAKPNGEAPTNWVSKFGGSAWEKFGDSNQYYLHLYDKTQADLNWRNPVVRQELQKVVNFWLGKGVKGFRFDVLNVIGKSETLIDSVGGESQEKTLYTDTPIVHEFVKELSQESFGTQTDIMTVGEMSSTTIEQGIQYTNPNNKELSMIFSFHHLKVDYKDGEKWSKVPFDFHSLKQILNEWQTGMSDGGGWNALFWNNHDQPRANSRFADPENYPFESASLLAQTIHLLRGTPYVYQGEEIGMTNPNFDDIESYVDVETQNAYKLLLEKGYAHEEAMAFIKEKSRDNSRTPMQWNNSENAGFSKGTPWISVASNYQKVNVANELATGKIFKFYKNLIALRKQYDVISHGEYRGIQLDHDKVYAYVREYEQQKLIVLNHFYDGTTQIDLTHETINWNSARVLHGNYDDVLLENTIVLRPYETVAILVEK